MPETVAEEMPDEATIAECAWLPEDELAVYAGEYERTGFHGGLNWYRARLDRALARELEVFAGRTIDVPACFISGASDWGVYQTPGALERMRGEACTDMRAVHLVEGAGHWVQQERPREVLARLVPFLNDA